MKKQLITVTLVFIAVITIITLIYNEKLRNTTAEDTYEQQLVDLNEIAQLSRNHTPENDRKLEAALTAFKDRLSDARSNTANQNNRRMLWVVYGTFLFFSIGILTFIYWSMLRPFDKLQSYAEEIAKGNFEVDLRYERTNYFGKFTWAFDHMRREITRARACEKEAIDNNKTVIATLSHDIKTPISSIRAYAEGLDANLDSGPEMRRKYSSVIMKKCDEVTKLTNDLFLHSLSDLDKLKMNPAKVNIYDLLGRIISELKVNDGRIVLNGSIPDVTVWLDEKRFEQVIENLVNNAEKYAPESRIEISSELAGGSLNICIQDHGPGIPDEDMPFIFDKFYRGKNAGDRQGSGLGLYIVKYIMEQLEGSVTLQNQPDGLKVILILPYNS